MKRHAWAVGCALSGLGCAAASPATTAPASSADAAARPADGSPADQAPLVIAIGGDRYDVDGEAVRDALALRGLVAQKLNGRREAIIRSTPDTDAALLLGAITAAQGTALESLRLECGQYQADLSGSLGRQPVDEWLTLHVDKERPQLSFSKGETRDSPAELSFTPGDPSSEGELSSWLGPRCKGKSCMVQLRLTAGAKLVHLAPTLDALRRVSAGVSGLALQLHDERPPGVGVTNAVGGRLPPEVIQRIVRENFGKFRGCYEKGLARDATLTGKVVVRFVIARDGTVSSVIDGGSDLPDTAVRDCVLQVFHELRFPEPEGGIVTVVYPIMLAPG